MKRVLTESRFKELVEWLRFEVQDWDRFYDINYVKYHHGKVTVRADAEVITALWRRINGVRVSGAKTPDRNTLTYNSKYEDTNRYVWKRSEKE